MSDTAQSSGLAHMVFFTLKDRSPTARDALVAACDMYLTDHPGTIHYSAGPRAEAYQRPVNDQEFDVALVLIFATDEDHQRYQTSERHQQFLAEQLENCSTVRVFDAIS